MNNLYILDNLKTGGGRTVGLNYLEQSLQIESSSYYLIPDDIEYTDLLKKYNAQKRAILIKNPRKYRVNPLKVLKLKNYIKNNKIGKIINLTNMPVPIWHTHQVLMIHSAHLVISLKNDFISYTLKQKVKLFIEKKLIKFSMRLFFINKIIVQTNFMKEQFKVIYNDIVPLEVIPSGTSFSDTNSKYIFYPGDALAFFVPTSSAKHKNNRHIIDVSQALKEKNMNIKFYLTIPSNDQLSIEIKEKSLTNNVFLIGKLTRDEVKSYYENCDAIFLPTLLESFCLPYLEAIYHRKYVLTSDFSFSREVCGDSGIYFNPININSTINAIRIFQNIDKPRILDKKIKNEYLISWEESFKRLLSS